MDTSTVTTDKDGDALHFYAPDDGTGVMDHYSEDHGIVAMVEVQGTSAEAAVYLDQAAALDLAGRLLDASGVTISEVLTAARDLGLSDEEPEAETPTPALVVLPDGTLVINDPGVAVALSEAAVQAGRRLPSR